jgi:hypothetical protein
MFINKIKNRFFLDDNDKFFINFASKFKKIKSNNLILIEAPIDDKFFLIKNFLIGQYLSKKYDYELVYYINFNNLRELISTSKKFYYKFVYNYFSFLKIRKLYDSFCSKLIFNCYYPKIFILKKKNSFFFKEIFKYKYKGIIFGDLIIDSYLYYFHKFLYKKNINLIVKEKKFQSFFYKSIQLIENFFYLFETNNIKLLVNNYSGYLEHGIAARIAEKKKIPIYYLSETDRAFIKTFSSKHKRNYQEYKENFLKLSKKNHKINFVNNILKKRFIGNKKFSLFYIKDNLFSKTDNKIFNNNKKTICIFAHCTLDSLYGFKNTIFLHQREWILYTIKNLEKISNKFNICLKIHPNETHDGEIYIRNLLKKSKNVIILPKSCLISEIINSNLVVGITLHGTVGFELAYHSIPTIYCNDSPYTAFSFCIKPKSIQDYKNILFNKIFNIKKSKYYKKESIMFYYMNFLDKNNGKVNSADNLGFNNLDLNKFKGSYFKNYIIKLTKNKINRIFKEFSRSEKIFDDINVT